jgi:hypothetical protein
MLLHGATPSALLKSSIGYKASVRRARSTGVVYYGTVSVSVTECTLEPLTPLISTV